MRRLSAGLSTTGLGLGAAFTRNPVPSYEAKRSIYAEKVRAGVIVQLDGKYWRVVSNKKSQKGQMSASYGIKMVQVGNPSRTKEQVCSASHDLPDVKYERVRTLFSGFDDVDNACFVYPEHSVEAGKEVNIPAKSLPKWQQDWLAVWMPVDLLKIAAENEEEEDFYGDAQIPTSWTFTVEKLRMKGMYKMSSFLECDGEVNVGDAVNIGDKVKITIRTDGTAGFGGRAD